MRYHNGTKIKRRQIIMLVISLREFRGKQGFYMDKVKNGEDVLLKSRDNFLVKLTPVTEDDTLMTKEEYFAMLDQSIQQAKEGKVKKLDMSKIDELLGL